MSGTNPSAGRIALTPIGVDDAVIGGGSERGLRRSGLSRSLLKAYRVRRLRRSTIRVALRLEGGKETGRYYSATLRDILREYHGVHVGAYSYGACLEPGAFPPGVFIGRYVSIAGNVAISRRNHPLDRLSLHPFFYEPELGVVDELGLDENPLHIGHDAWIGNGANIVAGCRSIGVGAVIGAGSVVTRDVPDFAIVGGAPAKTLKMRFSPEIRAGILESRWWERTIEELAAQVPLFTSALDRSAGTEHPLLRPRPTDGPYAREARPTALQ
jgi:acetyltransferase-like isoleucine patch superfamily enzyme